MSRDAGRRREERQAFWLSLVLHAAIFALGWLGTLYEPELVEFVTYEIELVSPPPAMQAEESSPAREELVVERPEEERPAPPEEEVPPPPEPEPEEEDPEPEPEVAPEEEPETSPEPPAEEEPPPPDEEEPTPATTTDEPPEDATESGEGINVRLEGVRRDYPAYYDNIIRQIQRCFRWQGGGNWETTVDFVILRDGTADEIEFVGRSGNATFDFEAMGAVDCAGQRGFGPLPEDLPFDRLPVRFSFRPTGVNR